LFLDSFDCLSIWFAPLPSSIGYRSAKRRHSRIFVTRFSCSFALFSLPISLVVFYHLHHFLFVGLGGTEIFKETFVFSPEYPFDIDFISIAHTQK